MFAQKPPDVPLLVKQLEDAFLMQIVDNQIANQ